jgi:uncharacterized membrane protein
MTDTLTSLVKAPKTYFASALSGERFWEIDALRGLAVVMMIIYHFMYDLYYFGVSDAIFTISFWFYFQRTTATIFIVLVGLSLAVYRMRVVARGGKVAYQTVVLRGLRILAWGFVISVITWLVLGPRLYIRFGILHFIGVSILLAYPLLGRQRLNLAAGVALIALGKVLQGKTFEWPWFFWLGFEPADHLYVDFFPLIPWFGVILLGIWAGNMLYLAQSRRWPAPDLAHYLPIRLLQAMGRHSLPIYLLHQPILLLILSIIL